MAVTYSSIPQSPERRAEIASEIREKTGLSEAVLDQVVRAFYDLARVDPLIAHTFAGIHDWEGHIDLIARFWSSAILGTANYHGMPLPPHMPLQLDERHFIRWLELFEQAATAVCTPEGTAVLVERANYIGQGMMAAIRMHRGEWPEELMPRKQG